MLQYLSKSLKKKKKIRTLERKKKGGRKVEEILRSQISLKNNDS